MRTRSDDDLKKIIESFNEDELAGLMFGLFPLEKIPDDLSPEDCARMMELNPRGHY